MPASAENLTQIKVALASVCFAVIAQSLIVLRAGFSYTELKAARLGRPFFWRSLRLCVTDL